MRLLSEKKTHRHLRTHRWVSVTKEAHCKINQPINQSFSVQYFLLIQHPSMTKRKLTQSVEISW